jgi:hypothetical protein
MAALIRVRVWGEALALPFLSLFFPIRLLCAATVHANIWNTWYRKNITDPTHQGNGRVPPREDVCFSRCTFVVTFRSAFCSSHVFYVLFLRMSTFLSTAVSTIVSSSKKTPSRPAAIHTKFLKSILNIKKQFEILKMTTIRPPTSQRNNADGDGGPKFRQPPTNYCIIHPCDCHTAYQFKATVVGQQ